MRNRLCLFNNLQLRTKSEILFELESYSRVIDKEDYYFDIERRSLKEFISRFSKEIEKHSLPDLDKWWYYWYAIRGTGAELQLCYCTDVEYSTDGTIIESEEDSEYYTLIKLPATYEKAESFFDKYSIADGDIESLIRDGRIHYVKYDNGKWLVSELQEHPSEEFNDTFILFQEDCHFDIPLFGKYDILEKHSQLMIKREHSDYCFVVNSFTDSESDSFFLTKEEVGDLIVSFHKNENVIVHDTGYMLFRPCPKEEDDRNERIIKKVVRRKKNTFRNDSLKYGNIIVTMGPNRGRIGYYDDDEDGKCVVYFGDPSLSHQFHVLSKSSISNEISSKQLFDRIQKLPRSLFNSAEDKEHYEYLNELFYCNSIFNKRIIDAIYHSATGKGDLVFISHSSKDDMFARMIALDVREKGYEIFLDDLSIGLGERIIQSISESLDRSVALIMLVSDSYNKSVFCNDEWQSFYMKYSKQRKSSIIPIMIGSAAPPALLSSIKYIRYVDGNYDVIIDSVSKALRRITGKRDK